MGNHPGLQKKNELIVNGDFNLGLKNWSNLYFYTVQNKATTSVVDGVYAINITQPGTAGWHIVDQQGNISLVLGTTYIISFDAWSENPNTMDVFLAKNHDDYGNYYSTTRNLTSVKQKFIWTVTMLKNSDPNSRFGFGFGKFTGNVYLDNVSIERVAATGTEQLASLPDDGFSLFPNPTSGEILISCQAKDWSPLSLKLFNFQGQLISIIREDQPLSAGNPMKINLSNQGVTPGIYFLQLSNQENSFTRKVVLN